MAHTCSSCLSAVSPSFPSKRYLCWFGKIQIIPKLLFSSGYHIITCFDALVCPCSEKFLKLLSTTVFHKTFMGVPCCFAGLCSTRCQHCRWVDDSLDLPWLFLHLRSRLSQVQPAGQPAAHGATSWWAAHRVFLQRAYSVVVLKWCCPPFPSVFSMLKEKTGQTCLAYMCVCVCVSIVCVCVRVCAHVCMRTFVFMCRFVRVCGCVHMCLSVCLSVCFCQSVNVHKIGQGGLTRPI